MSDTKIPETLPDCELLDLLVEKVNQKRDINFDVFGRLVEFRQRVSEEVRQINELFPEYTPHDEQYHLTRLFHVADMILGRKHLEAMNFAELFVLAVALYGHDWGMSVSDPEKQFITMGKLSEGTREEDLWILPDEQSRFTRFVRNQRLTTDDEDCVKDIPVDIWREYVRQTHAFRSAERVRRFFEPIDGGVADAASRVCEGHWLDFEDLQDPDSYPTNFSVMRETVNLRALAVYLRLIDLLDLAEDRTPYVIWKFVAPRGPRSKMEWAKHRALRPVTCPEYQNGRVILVDGSTNDYEVYAALEDLRVWCEEQFRGCNDLLARMNDPRHKLDLYHIEWRVAARGFKKTSIRFEFSRDQMFEILSDKIYQGDPYVFLRELLQNSIDAIRMRREIIQKYAGFNPGNLGVIEVNVQHLENGDIIVTWTDDGIGMDEYIVENYLAVAGKSYYRSLKFEREGLVMDPISRFGIGILSCIMGTNHIEIETYKDQNLPPQSEPLKITIPDSRRQFRIETLPQETTKIGTTVRVFIEGKKVSDIDEENKTVKPLNATEYLSIVAGFVEFPIVITEGDRKTIILHPKQNAEAARNRFGDEFEVHQLDLSYPWSEAIRPQDLQTACEFFQEERLDLATDLGLNEYEGVLTYLVPINDEVDVARWKARIIMRDQAERDSEQLVRCSDYWSHYRSKKAVGLCRSSRCHPTYAVYRDGILLPATSLPWFISTILPSDYELPPRLVVNLTKTRVSQIDLSRTEFQGHPEPWDAPIYQAHLKHICKTYLKNLLALDPLERLYQMGRIVLFHNITPRSLWENFPHKHWPIIFLEAKGRLKALEWGKISTDEINLLPTPFDEEIDIGLEFFGLNFLPWPSQGMDAGPFVKWAGERILVHGCPESYDVGNAATIADGLYIFPVYKSHRLISIRFLQPPWEGDPPLLQMILRLPKVSEELLDIELLLERAVEDPTMLSLAERELLREKINVPEFIEFPPPFDWAFAYGWRLLNIKHSATQAIIRFAAALQLSNRRRTLPEERLGYLQDALDSAMIYSSPPSNILDSLSEYNIFDWEQFSSDLYHMWSLAPELDLFDLGEIEDMIPTIEEFVPGTVIDQDSGKIKTFRDKLQGKESIRPFGMPLR